MSVKALNPFAPFWYTPEADQGSENPTKFKIRGLNGSEIGYVSPEFVIDDAQRMVTGMSGKGIDLTLRYGLLDWENFENDNGKVKFSPNNFALIPHLTRVELAMQIIAASYVSDEEKKT